MKFTYEEIVCLAGIMDFIYPLADRMEDGKLAGEIKALRGKVEDELAKRSMKLRDELIETSHREGPTE